LEVPIDIAKFLVSYSSGFGGGNGCHCSFGVIVMAGKKKKKVEVVFLVCDETGDYNYTLRRRSGGEKLKLSKYSPRLRRHTLHSEKKK
jgi:large subunit ribosomal protein L33